MSRRMRYPYRHYGYGHCCGCWHHHYPGYPPPPPWWGEEEADEEGARLELREEIAALKEALGQAEARLNRLEGGHGAPPR